MASRSQKNVSHLLPAPQRTNGFALLLFFVSTAAYAAANGIIQLPETMRVTKTGAQNRKTAIPGAKMTKN